MLTAGLELLIFHVGPEPLFHPPLLGIPDLRPYFDSALEPRNTLQTQPRVLRASVTQNVLRHVVERDELAVFASLEDIVLLPLAVVELVRGAEGESLASLQSHMVPSSFLSQILKARVVGVQVSV